MDFVHSASAAGLGIAGSLWSTLDHELLGCCVSGASYFVNETSQSVGVSLCDVVVSPVLVRLTDQNN